MLLYFKRYSILAVILLSSCDYFFPALSSDKIDVIEASSFLKRHKDDKDVIIIDIRSKEAFDKAHLPGAVNMDYDLTIFPTEMEKLDKTKRYVIIDQNGKKSGNTLVLMYELRFEKPHIVIGGYDEWNKQNLPLSY